VGEVVLSCDVLDGLLVGLKCSFAELRFWFYVESVGAFIVNDILIVSNFNWRTAHMANNGSMLGEFPLGCDVFTALIYDTPERKYRIQQSLYLMFNITRVKGWRMN
jgi:hypothetical protein